MRSTIVAAAFAAGAFAVPYNNRRAQAPAYGDVDIAYDIVYVTKVVTVTGGAAPAYTPPTKHHGHSHKHSSKVVYTTTEEAAPAYTPAPTYEAPAPTYEAPAVYSSAAPSSSSPSGPASGSYQDTCLYHHNIHRANHSVPDVAWSASLEATAKTIAETCKYAHDVSVDGGGYGQNIAAGVESSNISAVITDLFYNGEEPLFAGQYGLDNPDMSQFELWGHFTQIVWKGTTEVGCYTADCSKFGLENTGSGVSPWFTVCNYKGPGNYAGEYGSNVLAPKNEQTASWSAGLTGY